jgi:DNA-binding response OmpR family regulator
MSILVVDDNNLLLSKIVRSLVLADHLVRSATSLTEARAAIARQQPRVLCLDLQLPDGNGLDWLQELRANGLTMPVVVISGCHSEENRLRAEQLGAAGFLAKPFSLESLHRLLDDLLTKSQATAGAPAAGASAGASPAGKAVGEQRLQRAKRGFVTRRVDLSRAIRLITDDYRPRPGDLVLGRVDRLRLHGRLELPSGRRSTLFPGDEYIGCFVNRYAPDQFEAECPEDLSPCHLVGAGGLTAHCVSRHDSVKPATEVTPLGVLADADGRVLNLADFALPPRPAKKSRPTVTAVLGSSMNAGKTTVLADMVLGLSRHGVRVGAAKVTGTGAGGDLWRMIDAGCERVVDFTDAGYASTYKLSMSECETILDTLVAELCDSDVDTILVEVADGVLQPETADLAASTVFNRLVDNVIFAAGDALSAANGAQWLEQLGLNVVAVAGVVTASPLAMRELGTLTSLPILRRSDLKNACWTPPSIRRTIADALKATA